MKQTGGNIYDGIRPLSELPMIIEECLAKEQIINTTKRIKYYNVPIAFDIETTSFMIGDDKAACMYEWTLGINNAVVAGRTWEEFMNTMDLLSETLQLDKNKRIIIYVHNLAFEFQFFRKYFKWEKVFALKDRKPVQCITDTGIEFRCSYILSNCSLAALGEQLRKYPVKKMVGDLDYTLPRHSKTPLTEKEWGYCENDVRVVMSYIAEQMELQGNITKLPLTNTGYVRRYCKDACYYDSKNHSKGSKKYFDYRKLMMSLTLDPDEYEQLKRGFQGGFTHANAFYSGKTMENVSSFDFTSSYPAVMLSEKFPMSKGEVVQIESMEQFTKNINYYCCLFDIEFTDLESITLVEHPLSISRCYFSEGVQEDNGRVVSAKSVATTITEKDFQIFRKFYKWSAMRIGTFRRYKKAYLPKNFILSILKLYEDKTTLKGVKGREEDYQRSKGMINSCYGMCVTDICRDEITYSDDWDRQPPNIEKAIEHENNSRSRFLFFAWGVWITAYARYNLFTGIYEFGNDYIYSDTDSVKVLNKDKHMKYIESYNQSITDKLKACMDFYHIPFEKTRPKTIKGIEKPIGVWDYEGDYDKFKTLGAKRYMVQEGSDLSITISGVNKKVGVPYLLKTYKEHVFEFFKDGLEFPEDATGKMTHTYIDIEQGGVLTDYLGNTSTWHELSSIHLENTSYNLSLSNNYINYLCGIMNMGA